MLPVAWPGEGERQAAYRALFRSELEVEAIDDIRKTLRLGMPLGNERFAETICGNLGIRHNAGKRGRPIRSANEINAQATTKQQDFGF